MIDQQHGTSPVTALVALGAAAAGLFAHWIQDAGQVLFAAPSPDDITAYAKAIVGAIAMAVNLAVGSYHALKVAYVSGRAALVRLQRGRRRTRRRKLGPAPPAPGG